MHLLRIALIILGVWTLLALPLALIVGRFLRVSSEHPVQGRLDGRAGKPFGRAA